MKDTSNSAMNAAFAFWIAKTTMEDLQLGNFFKWAKGDITDAAFKISGKKINKIIVLGLQEKWPAEPPSFHAVLEAAQGIALDQEIVTDQGGEWDPHDRIVYLLDSLSKAGPAHAAKKS